MLSAMALGPGLPTRMVWPSPFWRVTSDVPMVPPAPERFSTIADCPQAACRCCASMRPITSVLPPGAAGTIRRTVSVGRQSAPRLTRGRMAAAEIAAAPVSTRRRENNLLVTCCSLHGLLFCREPREGAGSSQAGSLAQAAALVKAQQLEQRRQVAELLARGRRGAADEVKSLAVLQPVIGEPLHLAVLVEIDRDHPLVDHLLVHERDLAFGALRNVVENFAAQGRDRGGRAHHDKHLILARPDRDLLERAGGQDIALLKLLAGAAAQGSAHQGDGGGGAHASPARGKAARRGHARACLAGFGHSGTGPVPLHRARR